MESIHHETNVEIVYKLIGRAKETDTISKKVKMRNPFISKNDFATMRLNIYIYIYRERERERERCHDE